ncbi:EamA family transporter [Aeromonas hydrophila]
MSHPRFHFVQAHGKVLLFTLLISLSFPIGSALTAVLDPLVVTWARYLLAALTFVILLACQRRLTLPSLRDLGRYTLISLPALCYFVAMFVALQETSALDASALYTTVPSSARWPACLCCSAASAGRWRSPCWGAWWRPRSSSFAVN